MLITKTELKTKLRRRVLTNLRNNGYHLDTGTFAPSEITKKRIRSIHSQQRAEKLSNEYSFFVENMNLLKEVLADGDEVNPSEIKPRLVEVRSDDLSGAIFRMATLNWSVPVSNGFGRRLRFLVMDDQNNKLIGLFALGDPVFNLSARDNWIGWTLEQKLQRLANVMDAYILGALPPYSNLIGGKLVAALATSREVQKMFIEKYGNLRSIICDRKMHPGLALITTTSALGKSSMYDRLKINGNLLFNSIGETKGFGHFHIPQGIFEDMRKLLILNEHKYANAHQYGTGPNWKFRVIREGLSELGLNEEYLSHGIKREVFAVPLAKNTREFLRGEDNKLNSNSYPMSEIVDFCKQRWIIPRSIRDPRYLKITALQTMKRMISI